MNEYETGRDETGKHHVYYLIINTGTVLLIGREDIFFFINSRHFVFYLAS